jgi:hypothetical protein
VAGTLFPLKIIGLKRGKTTVTKYSLKAGTRAKNCKVNLSWVKILILAEREKIPKVNTVFFYIKLFMGNIVRIQFPW